MQGISKTPITNNSVVLERLAMLHRVIRHTPNSPCGIISKINRIKGVNPREGPVVMSGHSYQVPVKTVPVGPPDDIFFSLSAKYTERVRFRRMLLAQRHDIFYINAQYKQCSAGYRSKTWFACPFATPTMG